MSMVTYPLNNIEYSAEDAELFHVTRTSGVYETNSFDYSITGADNTIVIGTGIAWIKNSEFSGKVVAQKELVSIDMGLPDSNYPRIDAIVIRFDANANATEISVKMGSASSSPVAPSVVRTESVYELHLYHVRRDAGSLTISASNITDLRPNENYCGLMSDSVTQAVDKTLELSGVAADAAAVGDALKLKAPASAIGTNKVFSKLTDIGIKEFPTTMKAVAAAMPNNSTLMLDSRDIISDGVNEISDLGLTHQGMYMFMKGNTTARLSLLHIYSTTSGSTCYMNYGGYAMTTDVVTWIIGERQDGTYPDCRWRTAADGVGEWINPPMVAGTEYRTTERWNGKPVYTQLVNFGALPDNTTKSVTVTASGVTDVVGYEARYSNGKSGAVLYSGGDVISSFTIKSGKFTFSVTAPANSSGYSLMILFKYVK